MSGLTVAELPDAELQNAELHFLYLHKYLVGLTFSIGTVGAEG